MSREKTQMQLTHTVIARQFGGGQTGAIIDVIADYASDPVAIAPSHEPMRLTCGCGDVFMFRLYTKSEHRRRVWRTFGRRLFVLGVAYSLTSLGAFLGFTANHALPLRLLGVGLFSPGLIVSLVTLSRLLFRWPKPYSFDTAEDKTTSSWSLQVNHGVKLS